MNYLAHAFLSFSEDEIQIGNLMGDFVKGNKFESYAPKIKQGILLHRQIDSFTDHHQKVHQCIVYFKPYYRLSGGVFIDILFDHFLANDTRYFTDDRLQQFTQKVYKNLFAHAHLFDEKMNYLFHHMTMHDWLYHYKFEEGLHRSIRGMCKRYPILGEAEKAIEIIADHYEIFQKAYHNFFPELMEHIQDTQENKRT